MNLQASNTDKKVTELQTRSGWTKALSLSEMEEAWGTLVTKCEQGYDWGSYEFDNDLSVRDRIDLVLRCQELIGIGSVEHLRSSVQQIDERFRALLRRELTIRGDDAPWWRRHVLKHAGKEYARDVSSLYGVDIQTR